MKSMSSYGNITKLHALRAGVVLVAVLALAGCLCTKPDCQFAITAPKDGAVMEPGDVSVVLRLPAGDFCTFAPKAYEVTLQDGTKVRVPAGGAAPSALFRGLGPGDYTANAVTIQSSGRVGARAVTHFKILAPPTPTPTRIPPTPTPVPVAAVPPPPPPPPPQAEIEGYLQDIFFDVNQSDVKPEYHDRLKAAAEWLKKHSEARVTIEGHCDVRGSNSTNLTLGDRRSTSTKAFLVSLGVDASRLTTTTVGEDKPFAEGAGEPAWKQNRRAHFIVTRN